MHRGFIFLNILRNCASNVVETFLNMMVSTNQPEAQTNRKHKYALLASRYPGRQEFKKVKQYTYNS